VSVGLRLHLIIIIPHGRTYRAATCLPSALDPTYLVVRSSSRTQDNQKSPSHDKSQPHRNQRIAIIYPTFPRCSTTDH
jgi:hypothetical protein